MEPVVGWDVSRVVRWFNQNGFPGYDATLKEHSIDGEVLVNLDHESLKDLGIRALGKRLLVLKSIYFLKLQHDIPITSDSYVPQTVDVEPDYPHGSSFQRKQKRQTDESISRMMEEISQLYTEMNTIRNDMQRIYRLSILENKPLPALGREGSGVVSQTGDPFGRADGTLRKNTQQGEYDARRDRDQTKGKLPGPGTAGASFANMSSAAASAPPGAAPAVPSSGAASSLALPGSYALSPSVLTQPTIAPHIRVYGDNALQRENEAYKSFRISVDDPCSKILPHALKKYHIDDNWSNYTLCIQYGASSKGKKIERELNLDEKPLYLFQQLKDAGEFPVFVLKLKRTGAGAAAGDPSANQVYMSGAMGGSQPSLFSIDNNGSSSSLESPIHNTAPATTARPPAYLNTNSKASSGSVASSTMVTTPTSATLASTPIPASATHDADKL
ncbi:hypothetical protein GQ54DRAFT_284233 [Martensiomyces pterosporus]|nr:hypothetical protein GQ54DRAFT_284233 [Martensiomyces pterosporus]